jgi:hypothetical protein
MRRRSVVQTTMRRTARRLSPLIFGVLHDIYARRCRPEVITTHFQRFGPVPAIPLQCEQGTSVLQVHRQTPVSESHLSESQLRTHLTPHTIPVALRCDCPPICSIPAWETTRLSDATIGRQSEFRFRQGPTVKLLSALWLMLISTVVDFNTCRYRNALKISSAKVHFD